MTVQQATEQPAAGIDGATRAGERHLPGDSGMWLFVLGDMFFFLVYFVIFMVYRHWHPALFLDSQRHLDLTGGVVNTLVLLASSCLVALAVLTVRAGGNLKRASMLVTAAAGCGVLFMAVKAYEWIQLTHDGYTFPHNDFFMFYFALTGVHLFHVLIGLVVLGVVQREIRSPRVRPHVVEAGATYWHMVDLLWVVLFALLYVMR
jgi:nitric oxide reductase NorE protein